MDAKTEKHIDQLYRNSRQMVLLSILGLFVPIVLVIAAPLGIMYALERSRLLKKVDRGNLDIAGSAEPAPGTASASDKITYLRERPIRFLIPAIIVGAYLVLIAAIILLAEISR